MKALVCPHCQTAISEDSRVCRGCGAEIVRGASRRERSLTGVVFAVAAMMIAVVLFRILEIARGAPPLSSPKAEDGLLFLVGLIAVVLAPYIMGTRVARLLLVRAFASTEPTSINSQSPEVEIRLQRWFEPCSLVRASLP